MTAPEASRKCPKCGSQMISFKQLTHGNKRNSWYCPRCQKDRLDAAEREQDKP
ncbi:rubredoxin [Bradyrhizobium elkanii]